MAQWVKACHTRCGRKVLTPTGVLWHAVTHAHTYTPYTHAHTAKKLETEAETERHTYIYHTFIIIKLIFKIFIIEYILNNLETEMERNLRS